MRILKALPLLLLVSCSPNSYEDAKRLYPEAVELANNCVLKGTEDECIKYCKVKYTSSDYWEISTCKQTVRELFNKELVEKIENDTY